MKRKLSAIIALVLAVVMVFPTAVFVGAETTADVMKATVTGGIKSDGTPDIAREFTTSGTVTLALTGTASGTLTLPEGYSTPTAKKTTDNGAAFAAIDGKSFTITAANNYATDNKAETFEFSSSKTVTDAEGKETTTTIKFTLTVNVVPKKIIDMKIYGTSPAFNGVKLLDGSEEYNATEDLTITKADVLYNTDKGEWKTTGVAATTSNMKLDIIHTDTTKSRPDIKTMVADLIGDDDYLAYTYTDSDGLTYSNTIDLHVTTSDVQSLDIQNLKGEMPSLKDESFISENGFLDRIQAVVKLKEHEASLYYTGQQVKTNSKFTITYYEDSQYKAEIGFDKEAYFTISYEDAIFKSTERVKDYFICYTPVPVGVSINWDKAKTTTYYEGYVIGSNIEDWDGVKVTVTYRDNEGNLLEPVLYDTKNAIADLDIVLSPINARQKFVTIKSVEGYEIGTASNLPTGFELLYREVTSISVKSSSNENTKYTAGDSLNLSGVTVTINYNYGDPDTKSLSNTDYFTTNPSAGDELNTSNKSVLIVYTDPNTGIQASTSMPITVSSPKTTLKDIQLLSSSGAKKDYFIGEAFDASGFELLFIFSDASTQIKDLSDFTLSVDSSVFSKGAFTKAMNGTLTVNFTAYSTKITLNIPGISVTKRPTLTEISATTTKMDFLEGEAPKAKDFVVTAKYDDNSTRVFTIDSDDTYAEKSTAYVTKDGVQYTLKLTPVSIEEGTDSIRVTYTEKITATGVSTTKYTDVDIDVTVPEAILTYYDVTAKSYVITPYEDFYDALEAAEEAADSLTSYYASRVPEIELRKDVVMTADFPTRESMEIDLNGHSLTMIRGELYVASNAGTAVEVVFQNSDKADAKLIYSSDAEEAIIIAYNESYTIDRDSSSDGKYEVKISSVKNGKVTGPEEVTHGHDAKFTITPNEDYEIATIKVNNKSVSIPENGELVIEDVQEALTVTVTFQEKAWDNPFTDIYKSATYYKSIQFVYENGLFTGTSATEFEPDTTMTRAMFVTVLGRMAGVNVDRYQTSSFTDVPTGQWYSEYVQWASSIGLVEGYGDGTFGPNDAITHAQMYVLMQRYAALVERMNTNANGATIAANDTRDIPDWAYDAVEYAAKNQFLVTSSYRLTPNANAKRSELATLLEKFCTNVLDWAD